MGIRVVRGIERTVMQGKVVHAEAMSRKGGVSSGEKRGTVRYWRRGWWRGSRSCGGG